MPDVAPHAPDDSKLEFSTNWDIDQLIATGTISLPVGDNVVYTFADASQPPVFELMANPDGNWYQPGQNGSQTGAQFRFLAMISGNQIRAYVSRASTIRYYIWSDRIIY